VDAKGSLPTPDPNALAIRAFAFMFGLPVLLILLGLPLALWKEDWREQRPWQYVIAMAALWIVTALVLAQTRRERLSALREWFGRLRAADVVIALVLTAAGVAAMYFFSSATGLPRQWHLPTAAPVERLLWVPLCLSVGFCEEVIYRGYCLSRLTLA
jgi:membrane protease YdiL (CAAX protease family)